MNKITKKLILALSILLFIQQMDAQNAPNITDATGKKQGHWIKVDENKKKIYDGNFVNNIPDGKFIYFFETGSIKAITAFSLNGKVALTQHFNEAGKMVGEGKYIDQKKDSLWKFYDVEGKLLSDEIYKDGLKNGSCKVYYQSGQLSEDKLWVNGIADGSCTKYFESGTIKFKGQFIKDKAEGKTTFYFPSGQMSVEGFYKNDFKDGPWNYYNEDGTLKKTVHYFNGVPKEKSESNVMTKEEEEKAKKQSEQIELKDPFKDGIEPK